MKKILNRWFPVGTRSILFGAHCWFIHPIFVAIAWWKLYGFPWDPRLWVAFFVHDLGYWGKSNMDGPEGEDHPWVGARLMAKLFDPKHPTYLEANTLIGRLCDRIWGNGGPGYSEITYPGKGRFLLFNFCLFHSRFMSKRYGSQYSKLCVADKLAMALEPAWFYLPRVWLSGELKEYMNLLRDRDNGLGKYAGEKVVRGNQGEKPTAMAWWRRCSSYCRAWAYEHRDCKEDTWTPEATAAK